MEKRSAGRRKPSIFGEHDVVASYATFWVTRSTRAPRNAYRRFLLHKDDNGIEFVTFAEGVTKTRQSGLRAKPRLVKPKMFASGNNTRCSVALFKNTLKDV